MKKAITHLDFCEPADLFLKNDRTFRKESRGSVGPCGDFEGTESYYGDSEVRSECRYRTFLTEAGRKKPFRVRDLSGVKFVAEDLDNTGVLDVDIEFNDEPRSILRDYESALQQYYVTGADWGGVRVVLEYDDEGNPVKEFRMDERAIIVNRFTDTDLLPQEYKTKLAILQVCPALEYIEGTGVKITNSYFIVLCNDKRIKWETLQNCYRRGPITPLNKLDNKIVVPVRT